jgi:hypothetical protein
LIGRLGLGILALAQVCTQFDIVSHHSESKTAFEATIKFPPYTRQEMDKVAKKAAATNEDVYGGQYLLNEIPYDPKRVGVRVFTKSLREAFRKIMSNLDRYGNQSGKAGDEPYATFDKFLDSIYGTSPLKSLNLHSDYDQLLFGLALASPLPFVAARNIAVKLSSIKRRQTELESYNFRVLVDNLTILNPTCLPSDSYGHTADQCKVGKPEPLEFPLVDGPFKQKCKVSKRSISVEDDDAQFNLYEFSYDDKVAGRPLTFTGYLFQQNGRLFPRDIQGILIRINNVAIGKYDNSMLAYPYAEGPRYAMVTSELFVRQGFEDALNIDRDSFNELHAHYLRVQAYLHGLLHELIFPATWTEEKTRNTERRRKQTAALQTNFSKNYRTATGEPLGRLKRVERESEKSEERALREPSVDFTEGEVEIDLAHPLLRALRRKTKHLPLIEKLVIAFERANFEANVPKRRELFYRLLIDIFKDI